MLLADDNDGCSVGLIRRGIGIRPMLRRATCSVILFKVMYLACLSVALLAFPLRDSTAFFHSRMLRLTTDKHVTFSSHFCAWDSEHYLNIASRGYETGSGICAFYPLFPWMIKAFSFFTGGNFLIAGMIVANLFSLIGEVMFFYVVNKRFGESVAWLSLTFLLIFPGSLFFQFIYTEGLFFFLLMLLVCSLEENWLGSASAAALLLPLTRAVGIFSLIPIACYLCFNATPNWVSRLVNENQFLRKLQFSASTLQRGTTSHFLCGSKWNIKHWGLLIAPICGWIIYFAQMWVRTGNPFEGFEAQKQFGCESLGNIFRLPQFACALVTPTNFHEFNGSLLDRCCFILLVSFIYMIWRLDKYWLIWSFFLGIIPAMSGTFVSYMRFASVVFPLFVSMAVLFAKRELACRLSLALVLCSFIGLHVLLLWRFVNYQWAG